MMVKCNLKHKVKEFHVGDCVIVRISRIDWASTDPNRLPCMIVQVIGAACAMYHLRCKSGVLNKCYSACDLEFFEGNFCVSVKGWERSTHVSLRAASKESTPWSAFSKNRCKCTAGCSTQWCPCKKNKIECTSHCRKGDNCNNKNCTPASAMKSSTPSELLSWIPKHHCHVHTKRDATVQCIAAAKRTNHPALLVVTQDILVLTEITQKPLCKMDLTAELSAEDEDTWVTICTVQLTMYHKAILASPKSWLDDHIITAALYMLKQQHPSIDGFQPPALSQNFSIIPPQEQFVQIINVNKNHWIALSTVGCQKACIKIFD